jgi:catechol 2,3-dioxygenase-like lactoylglutathione lyase family enzyme
MDTAPPPTALLEGLAVVTLFTEDLAAARDFYAEVLGLPLDFEDADSVVVRTGGTLVNLLRVEEADELVAPAPVGGPGRGARALFTTHVRDVDATAAELARRGVTLLNGPVDRPWGPRTAAFADPAGNVWEIAGPPRPPAG